MPKEKIIWITIVILFVSSLTFSLQDIDEPGQPYFDETHYVPAARTFIDFRTIPNIEHPPLAKLMIAQGMLIFGDKPIGWRVMSAIFGALTLVAMYLWALVLFRRQSIAVFVALITLVNFMFYIQSRIAMLDTFMFAFMAMAMASFSATWAANLNDRSVKKLFVATGVFLGLATATKWFGAVLCAAVLGLYLGFYFLSLRGKVEFPESWKKIDFKFAVMALSLFPAGIYLTTFLPLIFLEDKPLSFIEIFTQQWKMLKTQTRMESSHTYKSMLWQWPLLTRPIWYAFDELKDKPGFVRGIFLVGNPVIMWSGLLAVCYCLKKILADRSREAFIIFFFFNVFLFGWLLVPKQGMYFYYYYPAAMVLSLAIGYFFHSIKNKKLAPYAMWSFLVASVALFIFFFPVLSYSEVLKETVIKWIWFRSWM